MRSSYSGSVIGPKMSTCTLPRIFMPAPWITRTLVIIVSVRTGMVGILPDRERWVWMTVDRSHRLLQDFQTMTESSADVVIVGGGIAGMTAAYYLAKAGVASVVVERDAIGSHASGFAYGGLSPLSGFGIPAPQAEIAFDVMRLHRAVSK